MTLTLPRSVTEPPAAARAFVLSALLVAATLLAYAPSIGHAFVLYDDDEYVVLNETVRRGLTPEGVRWAFTTGHAANWHPLSWLSHMLDVEIHGMWAGGHHLTSVLLHASNTALLFTALRRLTGAQGRSAVVAALFALHPLHVESVAWIAERKDVLCAFFTLLTLLAYASYAARPSWKGYALVTGGLALALLSKPMAVSLPMVLLLLDVWPLRRWRVGAAGSLVVEKLPLFLLAAASSAVTLVVQQAGRAVAPLSLIPFTQRLENAVVAYARYVGKMFWPTNLAVHYPMPRWPAATVIGAVAFLAATTALVAVGTRRRPYLAVGWLWFLGTLLPTIGLVQVGSQAMADRYTYLPLVGLFLPAVWGLHEVGARVGVPRVSLGAIAAIVLGVLLIATRSQLATWRNPTTLFTHALAVTSDNAVAHYNLANALVRSGRLDEGIAHYRAAIGIDPGDARAHNNLGNALALEGRVAEAVEQYRQALRTDPSHRGGRINLALLLRTSGRNEEAAAEYRAILEQDPASAEAHYGLGVALLALGQRTAAIAELEAALRLRPEFADARDRLQWARAGG